MTYLRIIFVAVALTTGIAPVVASPGVFWTRADSIWQADLDGANVQSVISGGNLADIALDTADHKLYLTDRSWGIYRVNADGTGKELIVPIENLGDSNIAVVPEPATIALLALGGLMMLRRRR